MRSAPPLPAPQVGAVASLLHTSLAKKGKCQMQMQNAKCKMPNPQKKKFVLLGISGGAT